MKIITQYKFKFGIPSKTRNGYLVVIDLSYPMRIALDIERIVKNILLQEPLKDFFIRLR